MSNNCKTALITGAAGGIGRALSTVFQKAGYHVIATDIMEKPAELECDSYVAADLNRYAHDQAYADVINSQISRISKDRLDVLINNAAVQVLGGVDNLSRDDWQVTLNVNVIAAFLLAQALLQKLEMTKGSVINIGSIHARLTKKKFCGLCNQQGSFVRNDPCNVN